MTTLDKSFVNTSISHATLRTEDLVKAFGAFLKSTLPEVAERVAKEWELNDVLDATKKLAEDRLNDFLYELFDTLNDIAPDGCYFGAHPGNGSDMGFWLTEEE